MTTDKDTIKVYEQELKRLRLNNLKLRIHMDILVCTPNCKMAENVRKEHNGAADLSESIIHLN